MAHRCRTCGEAHFDPASGIAYPLPEALARLEPFLLDLLEAAREFVANAWTPDKAATYKQIEAARPILAAAVAEQVEVEGIVWRHIPGSALEFVEGLSIEVRQHAASFARFHVGRP